MVWAPHVTVAAIIELDHRFLLVKEAPDGVPVFNQPAGHLEADESLQQAVVREVLEETGYHFTPESLVGIYRYQPPGKPQTYLRFCFAGSINHDNDAHPLDPDIIDTEWLSLAEIREHDSQLRSEMVIRCIDDYLNGNLTSLEILHELS
ncbi:MAG: NUDIX hydrolase [bacterium]